MLSIRVWVCLLGVTLMDAAARADDAAAARAVCAEVLESANAGAVHEAFHPARRDVEIALDAILIRDEAEAPVRFLGKFSYPGAEGVAYAFQEDGVLTTYDARLHELGIRRVDASALRDGVRWAPTSGIVHREGRSYAVASEVDRLAYIVRLDAGPSETLVCEFGQRRPPHRAVVSGGHAACDALLAERVVYPSFDMRHEVSTRGPAPFPWPLFDVLPNAAQVDLDADGKQELVVRYQVWSNGGNCSSGKLGFIDDRGRRFVDGALQNALQALPATCNSESLPFEFGGRVYLESRIEYSGHHARCVHVIEHGKLRELCKIDTRVENFLLPPRAEVPAR